MQNGLKATFLAVSLLVVGCNPILDKQMCMRYDGGSPLHGAILRDEWGQGGYYQVMDDRFWQQSYPEGTWVEFDVKRILMNSGTLKVEAVKYKGDCPKQ